jgi:epoxyqueuosine reductase
MKPKLLLHICCGVCSLHVVDVLRPRFEVSGFFYNPNIHPKSEYDFRRRQLERAAAQRGFPVEYAEYDFRRWFSAVRGLEKEPERGRRCEVCISLRLERTFRHASENGFSVVASTLSIGRQKSTPQINSQGAQLEARFDISFLAENFKSRDGSAITRAKAAALGVGAQNYCGCVYSLVQRKLAGHGRFRS